MSTTRKCRHNETRPQIGACSNETQRDLLAHSHIFPHFFTRRLSLSNVNYVASTGITEGIDSIVVADTMDSNQNSVVC